MYLLNIKKEKEFESEIYEKMSGFERDSASRIYYRKIAIQKEINSDFNPGQFFEFFRTYQGKVLDDNAIDKFYIRIEILIQQVEVSPEEIDMLFNLISLFKTKGEDWELGIRYILFCFMKISDKKNVRHIIWDNSKFVDILIDIHNNLSPIYSRKAAYIFCSITRNDTVQHINKDIFKIIIGLFKSNSAKDNNEICLVSANAICNLCRTKWANIISSDLDILELFCSNKHILQSISTVKKFMILIVESLENETFLIRTNVEYKPKLIECIDKLNSYTGDDSSYKREIEKLSSEAKEILGF